MKKIALLIGTILLVGCEPTPMEIQRANALTEASAKQPDVVAQLPDGRHIKRITVDRTNSSHPHYVYFIDGAQVTTNSTVPSGKTTRVLTVAHLGDMTVEEYEAETATTIKQMKKDRAERAAAELKKAQEEYDKAMGDGK